MVGGKAVPTGKAAALYAPGWRSGAEGRKVQACKTPLQSSCGGRAIRLKSGLRPQALIYFPSSISWAYKINASVVSQEMQASVMETP